MKITAIIPAHITEPLQVVWLREAVLSLYQLVDEIIVMDDASTVSFTGITDIDDNIQLFRTDTRQGTSRARNLAVERASNPVIFPLDCDDLVVPTTFEAFAKAFDGTPLYPDLIKISQNGDEKRHVQMDFSCDALMKYVIASVNVLHFKYHWEQLNGWNEEIDYIEDGEYNARLMYIYSGKRFPEPVVKYRQHKWQKTKIHADEHDVLLRRVITQIRSYKMAGCCGGRRPTKTNNVTKDRVMTTPKSTFASKGAITVPAVPGSVEGLVLVKYTGGKGKGKHYYRGQGTNFAYKVLHNQYINVDPADANSSLFERVVREQPKPLKAKPKPVTPKPITKKEEPKVERKPVVAEELMREAYEADFGGGDESEEWIDMSEVLDQNYRKVIATLEELSPSQEEAEEILDAEKQGRNRKKVVEWLERRL